MHPSQAAGHTTIRKHNQKLGWGSAVQPACRLAHASAVQHCPACRESAWPQRGPGEHFINAHLAAPQRPCSLTTLGSRNSISRVSLVPSGPGMEMTLRMRLAPAGASSFFFLPACMDTTEPRCRCHACNAGRARGNHTRPRTCSHGTWSLSLCLPASKPSRARMSCRAFSSLASSAASAASLAAGFAAAALALFAFFACPAHAT